MKKLFLRRWHILCMLLLFGAFYTTVYADDNSDPKLEFIDGDNTITPESPSVKMRFLCADIDGYDSYWDNQNYINLEVCRNGKSLCRFEDLNFLVTKGDAESVWENHRREDNAWRKVIHEGKAAIVFYNPYRSGDQYWVNIEMLPLMELNENDNFTIRITGHYTKNGNHTVVSNGYSKNVEVNLTTAGIDAAYFRGGTYARKNGAVVYTPNNLPVLPNDLEYLLQFEQDNQKPVYHFHPGKQKNVSYLIDNTQPFKAILNQSIVCKDVEMKDGGKYTSVFKKTFGEEYIQGYVKPTLFMAESDSWRKEIKLSWRKEGEHVNEDGKWVVLRSTNNASSSFEPLDVAVKESDGKLTAVDTQVEYGIAYKYQVYFVPNEWESMEYSSQLSASAEVTLSDAYTINLTAIPGSKEIHLKWNCAGFNDTKKHQFVIYRSINSDKNYENIKTIDVLNNAEPSYEYIDKDNTLGSPCDVIRYKVGVNVFETTQYSSVAQVSLEGTTTITHMEASCGEFANMVRLKWEVQQVGNDNSTFQIHRKVLGSKEQEDWVAVGSVAGSDSEYMYEDHSVVPGYYYQYRITLITSCQEAVTNETKTKGLYFYADGFCMQKGSVSGRITYGTNVATEGVKVLAVQSSDTDHSLSAQFYSLRVLGANGGAVVPFNENKAKQIFGDNANFAIQMWVNLDKGLTNAPLLELNDQVGLYAVPDNGNANYQLVMKQWKSIKEKKDEVSMLQEGKVVVDGESYHHITCMYNAGTRVWQVILANADSIAQKTTFIANASPAIPQDAALNLGFSADKSAVFSGYIDEVRLWKRLLPEAEIVRNHCRILDGKEDDLGMYLMFDENIYKQGRAYDYSYGNDGAPNGLHANLNSNNVICSHVPTEEQLANYALTDSNGNYTLSALSIGKGEMMYAITPVMGVHRFDPVNTVLKVTPNALVHNGIDFKDQSSFQVSGYVYYENTNYPVKDCVVKVDGAPCVFNGESVKTDDKGKFVVSVPIGDHYISVEKEGHTFKDAGRYPADEHGYKLYTFDKDMNNLKFVDQTKAVVVGRVAGGAGQRDLPLGSGLGVANIGKATITLRASDFMMNTVVEQDGLATNTTFNKEPLSYAKAKTTREIACEAFAGGGSEEQAKTITIKTDPKTGEFTALLPPVVYTVEEVSIDNNQDGILFKYLPELDATDMCKQDTTKWSEENVDGDSTEYEFVYNASLNLTYYAPAVFHVEDISSSSVEKGAFGDKWAEIELPNGEKDKIMLYETVDNAIVYTQGYPCFKTGRVYTFALNAYEEYHNYDQTKVVVDKLPLKEALVTINNQLSGETIMSNSLENPTGVVEEAVANIRLDKTGSAVYQFVGGLPNVISPYTLSMNITYELNGLDASWEENGNFKGILLGSIPTGTNFMTEGPAETMFVLRDPPGSGSSASIAKGTVINSETSHSWSTTSTNEEATTVKAGAELSTAAGAPGLYKITKVEVEASTEIGVSSEVGIANDTTTHCSMSTTQEIATPSDIHHVGVNGDTYVGMSTNLSYGVAREVGFNKNDDGVYELGLDEILSCSKGYKTNFIYTQYDIETKIMPKWITMRDELLLPVGTTVVDPSKTCFVSKLRKDDPRYGSSNNDESVWGELAVGADVLDGPSYTIYPAQVPNYTYIDSIAWCNNQVANWEQTLANNEKQKVEAIEKGNQLIKEGKGVNYSLGDAPITRTISRSEGSSVTTKNSWNVPFYTKNTVGSSVDEIGVSVCYNYTVTTYHDESKQESSESTTTTSFTLSDGDYTDSHSIDVYTIDGDPCPIFYLKGGQTSCPYEAEQLTKYYKPGEYTLSVATQQVDKPKLICDNPVQTNVPAGDKATFELKLCNESSSNTDMVYHFSVFASSNPYGAEVKVDGVSPSFDVYLQPGQTLIKTLTIAQGNPDVMDYENITVALSSLCQNDPGAPYGSINSTVQLSAHFVPSCSKVDLAVDNQVVNQQTDGKLTFTLSGYNVNNQSLKNIQIQYKKPAEVRWTTLKGFYKDQALYDNWEPLGDKESLSYVLKMDNAVYADGVYQFRAITECTPVNNEPVYYEGEVIEVVKDMQGPMLISMPSPKDGVYDIGDDISVMFNEDIQTGIIQENTNIVVSAVLNEYDVDHAVAFYSDGVGAAYTEALVDLSNRPFALNFWLNYTQEGTIFTHGSKDNALQLMVKNNKTYIVLADKEMVEAEALPKDTWIYVSVSVDYVNGKSYMTMDYAQDAITQNVFKDLCLGTYAGVGTLNFGGSMVGSIHEVTLWNTARTAVQAFSEKDETKAPYTEGLIGYWKMDEGVGIEAKDLARNRHLTLPNANAWKLSTPNISLRLSGQEYAAFDMTACPTTHKDNYLLEFWFKADVSQQSNLPAYLLSTNQGDFALQAVTNGLQVVAKDKVHFVNHVNYLDNAWHHVALNVLNQTEGVSILYIDGNEVAQYAAGEVPGLQCAELRLGENMAAQFDELRYWKGTLTASFIRENMYHRESNESALLAYYSFEQTILDEGNQSKVVPTLEDKTGKAKQPARIVNEEVLNANRWESTDTPPLKAAKVMQNVPFVYTVSNREITIEPTIDLAQIEGTVLHFMVKGIQDVNGNYSDDIKWCANVQKNPLKWEENTIQVEKMMNQKAAFTATLKNEGGAEIAWRLNGLPTWLSVDTDFGTLAPKSSKTLNFTVLDMVSVGNYKANIYAEGDGVLPVSLDVSLTAYGDKPAWDVDPTQYTHSMNVVGKLILNGKVCENANSILAAFDGDECLGWAQPEYLSRYDTYYVMMTIYGNEEHNNRNLTFRAYDANTGNVHPYVTADVPLTFQADAMQGTYNNPVRFMASNEMEEMIHLTRGWDWISLCVEPSDAQVGNVLEPVKGNTTSIKSHDAFSSYNATNRTWMGNMDKNMRPDEMYKVYSKKNADLPVRGVMIDTDKYPITIAYGWNWISFNASTSMSITEAFANVSPQDGDVVKSQHQFAIYSGYEWVGSLQALIPGEGYVYCSQDDQVKMLRYPKVTQRAMFAAKEDIPTQYPGTMNMVVVVKQGDFMLQDTHVSVYAGDEWRGEETAVVNDMHFVNVYGQGNGTPLRFEVEVDGNTTAVEKTVLFQEDTLLGSLEQPLELEVGVAIEQKEISFYETNEGFEVYSSVPMKQLMVVDMAGRMVYKASQDTLHWTVNMQPFAKGVYVVDVLMDNGHTHSYKLMW